MAHQNDNDFAAWLGIDWADQKHAWALRTEGEKQVQSGELEHTPEAVDEFITGLAAKHPGRKIAVALEQNRGALAYMLCKYEHLVLFPVHPNLLDNYRKGFFPSGSKSDPGDAALILEVLSKHRDRLRPLRPDTVETRTIQFLVEARRHAVDDRTRYVNQLTAQLKMSFPQVLTWFNDVDSILVTDFLAEWPTLERVRKAKPKTVAQFLHDHRMPEDRAAKIQEGIEKAVPAVTDQAILEAALLNIKRLTGQLRALRVAIADYDERIDSVTKSHESYAVFSSFPGAGKAMLPRLIAAFGTDRTRFASAADMQQYSGIAPVTESSGKQRRVRWRRACPRFLRQTFHEWAWFTTLKSEWARAYYRKQRDRGKGHHASVRGLAFKWLRILFRCWKDGVAYDEAKYRPRIPESSPAISPLSPVNIEWKNVGGFVKIAITSA